MHKYFGNIAPTLTELWKEMETNSKSDILIFFKKINILIFELETYNVFI